MPAEVTRVDEALVTVQRTVPSSRMCFVATFGDTALPCSRCGVHRLCRGTSRLFCLSRSKALSGLRHSSMSKCRRCTFLHSVPCSLFFRENAVCTVVKLDGLLRPTRTRSKQLDERVATLRLLAFGTEPNVPVVQGSRLKAPFQSGLTLPFSIFDVSYVGFSKSPCLVVSPQKIAHSATVLASGATSHHSLMLCSFTKLVMPQRYLLKHWNESSAVKHAKAQSRLLSLGDHAGVRPARTISAGNVSSC